MGAKLVESGAHTKVLVIGADVMSSILDYTDRATCILFGDGAGAVLLEPCAEGEVGMIDFLHEIDGSGGQSLYMPAGGSLLPTSEETVKNRQHFVVQDGRGVYKFAVRKMPEIATALLARNALETKDLDCFIPPPSESTHHRSGRGASWSGQKTDCCEHRKLWKHNRRYHPSCYGICAEIRTTRTRQPCYARLGGCRIFCRSYAASLGNVISGTGFSFDIFIHCNIGIHSDHGKRISKSAQLPRTPSHECGKVLRDIERCGSETVTWILEGERSKPALFDRW